MNCVVSTLPQKNCKPPFAYLIWGQTSGHHLASLFPSYASSSGTVSIFSPTWTSSRSLMTNSIVSSVGTWPCGYQYATSCNWQADLAVYGCHQPLRDTWATGRESPQGTDEVRVPLENEIPGGNEQAATLKGAELFSPDRRSYPLQHTFIFTYPISKNTS